MDKAYDLVVIGTGSAASTVASRCRAAGWRVAVIDSRPFGGTCALRGCDPKKVLVGVAEVIDGARRLSGHGVHQNAAAIDWTALMRFKRSFTDPVPNDREQRFRSLGIDAFHGRARFAGPRAVRVGDETLEAKHVVIAAGAKPADLGIAGAGHVVISDDFLELQELPPRIVFVGGGYISFEFAHVAIRAGARVAILHRGPRPLEHFDPDLVDRLVARTRALGADVHLQTEVTGVVKTGRGYVVEASSGGEARRFDCDMVIHGAGRVPDIDDLQLEVAGVERDARGVRVNEYLQSVSNTAVYAAGDSAASGGPPLTPVAGYEGRIVAANLLKGNHQHPDFSVVPSVVFTLPPLASVGLGEAAARERRLAFKVNHQTTSRWYSSRRVGEEYSGFKVLVEEGSERILGAHLLGPHAEEVINLFALTMRTGVTASQIKEMMFAYPTGGSDIGYMV